MSYSKLIHDYLDGELDSAQQDSLFSQLAVDTDLRHEFHQQMKLQLMAQTDMSRITPPIESTNAIFSALGFSIPSAEFIGSLSSGIPKHPPIGTILLKSAKRYLPYAITTIMATVITALLFFYFFNKYFAAGQSFTAHPSETVPTVTSYDRTGENNSLPSAATLSKKEMSRIFEKTVRETITNMLTSNNFSYNLPNSPAVNEFNQINQKANNDNNISYSRTKDYSGLNLLMNNRSSELHNFGEHNLVNPEPGYSMFSALSGIPSDNTKFYMEVRNLTSKSEPNLNLPSGAKPWFTNISAALMYEFNKYHALGVSVGEEQFGQEFTRYIDNIVYTYKQNPTLFWYGLTYKLTLSDLLYANLIYPYASVVVGGTTVGPMGRVQAGLQYQPDKRVTFSLGGEASLMYYNVQNNIYNTKKYGITYGIAVHY